MSAAGDTSAAAAARRERDGQVDEIVDLLASPNASVRAQASELVAGLTADAADAAYLRRTNAAGELVRIALVRDRKVPGAVQSALAALINLSSGGVASGDDVAAKSTQAERLDGAAAASDADAALQQAFVELLLTRGGEAAGLSVVPALVVALGDTRTLHAELHAMLLCNITRDAQGCLAFLRERAAFNVTRLVDALVAGDEANPSATEAQRAVRQWVPPILENVTQVAEGRTVVLDPRNGILEVLLPAIRSESAPQAVRCGVLGVVKNCCFERLAHGTLADTALPYILWPLRDATQLPDRDNAKLHSTLQNDAVKRRRKALEPDSVIRDRALDALQLLTKDRDTRDKLRLAGVYPVLREYDKMEHDEDRKAKILSLVEQIMLIDDEVDAEGNPIPQKVQELPDGDDDGAAAAATDSASSAGEKADSAAASASSGGSKEAEDDAVAHAPEPRKLAQPLETPLRAPKEEPTTKATATPAPSATATAAPTPSAHKRSPSDGIEEI